MHNKGITYFIEVSEAISTLIRNTSFTPRIVRGRPRDLVGRPLVEDVVSPVDRHPYDMSHVDGFAIRSVDSIPASEKSPIRLRIEGCIKPSSTYKPIEPGKAVKIYTGGYLPPGADAVAPIEEVEVEGSELLIFRRYLPYENVDKKGSDVRKGETLSRSGEILTSTKAALFEALGIMEVRVTDKPIIGVLAFGDELTDDPEKISDGKTLNFSSPVVENMLENLGCISKYYGITPDNVELAKKRIKDASRVCDALITIGGSSVSEIDVASIALREMSDIFVRGLRLQPGRVGGFAVMNGKPIVILPGFIHATINVFNYLAAPLICHIQGIDHQSLIDKFNAQLAQEVSLRKWRGFRRIIWVKLTHHNDELLATPRHGQSSLISLISHSDGYIEAPPDVERLEAQSKVRVSRPAWLWFKVLR
jgi:molybdenum cofactor synthesis domain-containing protein